MDVLRWEDVLSSQQLLSCTGFWHDESGSGVRHSSSSHIWSEKCLHPDYVRWRVAQQIVCTYAYLSRLFNLRQIPSLFQDAKASSAAGSHSRWSPVYLQHRSTGWRRMHVGPQAQVSVQAGPTSAQSFSLVNSNPGPLMALKCCVNARLLSCDKKTIAVNRISKLPLVAGST